MAGSGAAVAMACGLSACSAAAPAKAQQPTVEITPPASTLVGLGSAPEPSAAPGEAPSSIARDSSDTVLDAYFAAAKEHRLEAMLDCFSQTARAVEAKKPDSFTHVLARPELTILSHRVTGAGGYSDYRDRKFIEEASIVITAEVKEGGSTRTLQMTFDLVKKGREWYLVDIVAGAVI